MKDKTLKRMFAEAIVVNAGAAIGIVGGLSAVGIWLNSKEKSETEASEKE